MSKTDHEAGGTIFQPDEITRILLDPERVELIFADEDEDVLRAGRYLYLKESGYSIEEITHDLGWSSRTSLYKWVDKWTKSGAMAKAKSKFLEPKAEMIYGAISKVLDHWPAVLNRVLVTALSSQSDRVSLEAAAWLHERVVAPALAAQENAGTAESAYANRIKDLLPNVVASPKFLTAKAKEAE